MDRLIYKYKKNEMGWTIHSENVDEFNNILKIRNTSNLNDFKTNSYKYLKKYYNSSNVYNFIKQINKNK